MIIVDTAFLIINNQDSDSLSQVIFSAKNADIQFRAENAFLE